MRCLAYNSLAATANSAPGLVHFRISREVCKKQKQSSSSRQHLSCNMLFRVVLLCFMLCYVMLLCYVSCRVGLYCFHAFCQGGVCSPVLSFVLSFWHVIAGRRSLTAPKGWCIFESQVRGLHKNKKLSSSPG